MRLFRLSSTTLTGLFLVLFYRPCCQNSLRETVIIYCYPSLSMCLWPPEAARSNPRSPNAFRDWRRYCRWDTGRRRSLHACHSSHQKEMIVFQSCFDYRVRFHPMILPLFAEVTEHRRMEHRRQWKFDETLQTRYTTATLWREYHIIIYYPYYTWQTSARRMRLHFK